MRLVGGGERVNCCSFGGLLFSLIAEMASCIRYEDRLDGMSIYLQWKVMMTTVLKENRLWIIVSTVVTPPPDTDPVALDMHEVKEAKSQKLILDGIRDHLIPHVAEKKTTYNVDYIERPV